MDDQLTKRHVWIAKHFDETILINKLSISLNEVSFSNICIHIYIQ